MHPVKDVKWDVCEEGKISESDDLEITPEDFEELKNILNENEEDLYVLEDDDELIKYFESLSDDKFNNIFSCLKDGSRKSKRKKRKTKSKKRKSKKKY